MIKLIVLFYFLTAPALIATAQETDEDCWRCIHACSSEDHINAIEKCNAFLLERPGSFHKDLAAYLLASSYMQNNELRRALSTLKSANFENKILRAKTSGLIGDCYSDLGEYEEAIKSYLYAAEEELNSALTPTYLFKAHLCSKALGKDSDSQMYLHTIYNRFVEFSDLYQIEKYLSPNYGGNELPLPEFPAFSYEDVLGYGTINGKRIGKNAFEEVKANFVRQNAYASSPINSETEAWNYFIQNSILIKELDELNIAVSEKELMSYLLGEDDFPVLQEFLTNFNNSETDEFDKNILLDRINEFKTSEDAEIIKAWNESEEYYKNRRNQEKYEVIINRGIFYTKLEINNSIANKEKLANISYVLVPYDKIPDSDIQFSKGEVVDYIAKDNRNRDYKHEYKSREFAYKRFSISPVKEDTLSAMVILEELKNKFENATNDSIFVLEHSDAKFYSPYLIGHLPEDTKLPNGRSKHNTYPKQLESIVQRAEKGLVIGPYIQDGKVKIAKIKGFTSNLITARHILIGAPKEDTNATKEAKEKAEQILKKINHDNFEYNVEKYSEDPGSKYKGGIYADFQPAEMVEDFANYGKKAPIGQIGIVQTDFGFHIMEVLKRKPVKYPILAIIEQKIVISDANRKANAKSLTEFISQLKSELNSLQSKEEKTNHLNSFIKDNDFKTAIIMDHDPFLEGQTDGICNEVFKFMYTKGRKEFDVTETPLEDEFSFMVGIATGIFQSGDLNIPKAEYRLEGIKKSRVIKNNLSELNNINDIAEQQKTQVVITTISLDNPTLNDTDYEPIVAQSVFDTKNKGLIIVSGKKGVYFIQKNSFENKNSKLTFEEEKEVMYSQNTFDKFSLFINALQVRAQVINNLDLHRLRLRP